MCNVWRMQNKPCQTVLDERAAAAAAVLRKLCWRRGCELSLLSPLLSAGLQAAADEKNANCCRARVSSVSRKEKKRTLVPREICPASIQDINNLHTAFSPRLRVRERESERTPTLSASAWLTAAQYLRLRCSDVKSYWFFTGSCLTYFTLEVQQRAETYRWYRYFFFYLTWRDECEWRSRCERCDKTFK